MKRFRFPLKSVATVRTWRERQAREAFAAAIQRLAQADETVQQARRRVAETEKVLRAGRAVTFRAADHAGFLGAYNEQLAGVGRAEQVRQEAKTAVDRARESWQSCRAELRAVGQLELRARQSHRLAEERAEQVALDELASIRTTRLNAPDRYQ